MYKVFIGYDERQPISYNVLQHSIIRQASKPISVTPLVLNQLPLKRAGLTPFTFSRFLVPYLCHYEGFAIFLDIDMLLNADIMELFALADNKYAIQVVKNEKTFEWASMMLFNCAKCQILTPKYVESAQGLHTINWCKPEEIGELPSEWNHLVGYDKPRDDAKLIHYTQGMPCFPEIGNCEYSEIWHKEAQRCVSAMPWQVLMGNSVHTKVVNGKRVPKLTPEGE